MKSRSQILPLLAAALLLLGAAPACGAQKPKPKDRGGISLVLAVKTTGPQVEQSVKRTAAVIEKRCDRLGIYCKLERQAGEKANQLVLRFSTTMDAARVKRVLLAEGFALRAVASPPNPAALLEYSTSAEAVAAAGADKDVFRFADEEMYLVAERPPIMTGDELRNCAAVESDENSAEYEVDCQLSSEGSARLKSWTGANLNRYVAVVFNRRALSAPYIRAEIKYNVVVSGGFDRQDAEDAAVILGSGNLPAPVEVLEEATYRP
ncbi:MAG: hypothetical protein H7Z38_11530 [Rubrivivax sp.]|nr:hypothetical protein [Pyrinomonadaceae bacterium]